MIAQQDRRQLGSPARFRRKWNSRTPQQMRGAGRSHAIAANQNSHP
jgi:hypothetical protein